MRARKYFLKNFCTFENYFCIFKKIFACSEIIFELFLKIFFANRRRRSGERVFEKIIFDSERFSIFLKSQEKTSRERKINLFLNRRRGSGDSRRKIIFRSENIFASFENILKRSEKDFWELFLNLFLSPLLSRLNSKLNLFSTQKLFFDREWKKIFENYFLNIFKSPLLRRPFALKIFFRVQKLFLIALWKYFWKSWSVLKKRRRL